MTLDDVKKKIRFWTRNSDEYVADKRCASIHLIAEVSISRNGYPPGSPPMEFVDEMLVRRLFSMLYDDRRREIQETLRELYMVDPHSSLDWHGVVHKLEKLLGYGPPI